MTRIADYVELSKPRSVTLMALTAMVAMILASPMGIIPWDVLFFGSLGIILASACGGVLNQLIDDRLDADIARAKGSPLPEKSISTMHAIIFSLILGATGLIILSIMVNNTVALLTLLTILCYATIYTLFIKRASSQSIIIGGIASAITPLLGWTAVTDQIDPSAFLLVMIIFTWTPVHCWSLAIYRHKASQKTDIPMLPVTHGLKFTRLNVLLYTILMIAVTYLPFVIDMSGLLYLVGATILNVFFAFHAIRQYRLENPKFALATYNYSNVYLMALFIFLILDHFLPILT